MSIFVNRPQTASADGPTANRLSKWLDGAGTLGNSAVTESAGKVGVGLATPNYEFTLFGSDVGLQLLTPATGITAADGFRFGIDSTNKPFFWNMEASDLYFGTSAAERMRISAAGNVGIGTTNPQSALQVNGYIQLSTITDAPPATDCDATAELGRMKVDPSGLKLYVCTSWGWKSATLQ